MSEPKYVYPQYVSNPLPAIRAGKTGDPEVLVAGGVLASGTITFADIPTAADTITVNGVYVEFTASASDATAAGTVGDPLLVNIKADLQLTLDEAIIVLNDAGAPAAAALSTYTNTATILTVTYDAYGTAGNVFTLAASSDTVSGATLTGGQVEGITSLQTEPTQLSLTQAVDQNFNLTDGDEAQHKLIYCTLQSGAGEGVVTPTNLTGGTTITFAAAGEYSDLRFINGSWVQVAGTATVA